MRDEGASARPALVQPLTGWAELRAVVRGQQALLSAPAPAAPGLCVVCHGPSGIGSARCFQCDLHSQCAQGSLADLVVPVAFAIKGSAHARHLWQYKSGRPDAAAAAGLRALLLVFLRDHGGCLWPPASDAGPASGADARIAPERAGVARIGPPCAGPARIAPSRAGVARIGPPCAGPARIAPSRAGVARIGPTHVAVVPTARGRPGIHPLRALVAPYIRIRWAELAASPGGQQARDLDPERFVAGPLPGAGVLLIDDTWTTGSSAQSAAMALRRAGARWVVTVVLGRHIGILSPGPAAACPAAMPFRPDRCAVHRGSNPAR